MSSKPRYESGNFKVICDVCGRDFRASEVQQRWDGLIVCPKDWETRQPQDFVRGVADKIVPPFTRPDQDEQFITTACTTLTSQGLAGVGAAGCARAGSDMGLRPTCSMEGHSSISGLAVPACSIPGIPYPNTYWVGA